MPDDLVEDLGFPPLTPEIRGKILGGNALRIHGLRADDVRDRIRGDAFEAAKAEGFGAPWGFLRRRLASGARR
jgi:hypothetical protein